MLLDKVKTALYISESNLDDSISIYINACLDDLNRVGVVISSEESPLVVQAVILYVMAKIDYLGEGERSERNYEKLRNGLSLNLEYNGGLK